MKSYSIIMSINNKKIFSPQPIEFKIKSFRINKIQIKML